MIKYLWILVQLIFLMILASWAIKNSQPVSFTFQDIIITTTSSILMIGLFLIVILSLVIQKIIFYIRQLFFKYKIRKERSIYEKGYDSFLIGMVAIANKDFSRAIHESKKVKKYFKDESFSLLLKSEALKVENKYDELHDVYENMLKNKNMNLLGLRGLMEHNLRSQDYHHAFIYGEKLFDINPRIDKLYETLINIISKTNNWQKLFQINDKALQLKIINKDIYSQNKSIAFFEIAKIKKYSFEEDAISLMEKALKLRLNFSPYHYFYTQLLIENKKLLKAKKHLSRIWSNLDNPDFNDLVRLLSKAMKISFYELSKSISSSSKDNYLSKILITESLIEQENWTEARKHLSPLLEHKPDKIICMLMAKIEEGDTNDPQKINSWISRSNFGKLNKIWICNISKLQQNEWSSISRAGHFNSLEWKQPIENNDLGFTNVVTDKIKYIDN